MSRRARIILISIVALIAVLAVVDRVSVAVAQNEAANELASNADFVRKPHVSVSGFPFLTQVVGGRYDDVRVTGTLDVGEVHGAQLDARLRGVHVALSDLVKNDVKEIKIDSALAAVTVSYAGLAQAIGVPGLTLAGSNGSVQASAGVDLPGVGTVNVSARADVLISTTAVHLAVRSINAAGLPVSAELLQPFVQSIQVPVDLPSLPYGLKLVSVRSTSSGVVATTTAQGAVVATN